MSRARWFSRAFTDRPLVVKIGSAVGIVLLVGIAVGLLSVRSLNDQGSRVRSLYNRSVLPMTALGHVHQEELKTRAMVASLAAAVTPADQKAYLDKISGSDADLDAALADY